MRLEIPPCRLSEPVLLPIVFSALEVLPPYPQMSFPPSPHLLQEAKSNSEFYDSICNTLIILWPIGQIASLFFKSDTYHLVPSIAVFWVLLKIFGHLRDEAKAKLKSLEFVSKVAEIFKSDAKYFLYLRSFNSKIEKESTYNEIEFEVDEEKFTNTRFLDRHGKIALEGASYRTGKKIKKTEIRDFQEDSVQDFLRPSICQIPMVILTGITADLTTHPLTLLTGANWFEAFEILLEGAQVVVIVPETSDSLREEIEVVCNTALKKTLILMPPSSGGEFGRKRKDVWENLRGRLRLQLPEYQEQGAIIQSTGTSAGWVRSAYTKEELCNQIAAKSEEGVPLSQSIQRLRNQGLLDDMIAELTRRACQ